MSSLPENIWQWEMLGIPFIRWCIFFATLFATLIIQRYLIQSVHFLSQKLADSTFTKADNIMLEASEKPARWLIMTFGIMLALKLLQPPIDNFPLIEIFNQGARITLLVLIIWFLWRLIGAMGVYFEARLQDKELPVDNQLIGFLAKTMRIFLVITGCLVIAQNMGYSISGLLASLGIGGIAIAMAAKDTIANVFGSIMILLDRPFTVGDWIKTSEFEGVVEEVGFRSTKIRTFEHTLVNIPNSILANIAIDNIDARNHRRVKMRIGITYDTTPEQMQQAITGIENILSTHSGVDQSFSLVKFDSFEDSSLSIFLYYFSSNKDWAAYLQVRQEVNLQIMHLLEELGLSFAFPTRTLHLHQEMEAVHAE